jgi:hypothetical protein
MAKALNWQKDHVRHVMQDQRTEAKLHVYSKTTRRALRAAVMPWGKHKGRRLSAIPQQYLEWLYGERPDGDWLRHTIGDELLRRARAARAQQKLRTP